MEEKRKILVIDDEEDLCLLVKDNLESEGSFEVVTLTDPLKAESICKEINPDLVLLDVVMPNRKGSEVAESLRKDPETKKIPIVVMSGLGEMVYFKRKDKWQWLPNRPIVRQRGEIIDEKDPQRAAEAYGVDDYINKPFATETLIEIINTLLKKKNPPQPQQ